MGSLHGLLLLRRPLPLLVTSLVLIGGVYSSQSALCDVPCCSVLPICDTARLVTCDCPHMNTMTLRKGDIPETVRAINILNTRHVTIGKDAISGLHSLTSFIVSGIDKLEIKKDGMASQKESELRSVTIQNVGSLQVEGNAFSGVWQPNTSIQMQRIGGLYVESNAFDYQVTELGPSVSLQHVELLNLKPNGFAASIFELDLYNVTMDVCHDGSFGGNILNSELNSVTIAEAEARCFYGLNYFSTFNIRSLKMQTAHPQAFSGSIGQLTINDSHFTTIQEKGFDIHVTSMQVSDTYIEDLRSNGLSVLASGDIRIEYLRIDDLRKNALAGLMITNGSAVNQKRLLLNQFEIVRAENRSLVLSEPANLQNLQIDYMHVKSWDNQVCPTEKWARMLTGASPNGPFSIAQHAVLSSLMGNNRCEDSPSVVSKVLESDLLDDHGPLDYLGDTNASRPSGVVVSITDTPSADGPIPTSGDVQPHESKVKAASHESVKPTDSGKEVDNHDSQPSGVVLSTADTLSAVEGPNPTSGDVQPHESEVEAASHELEEPFLTESRERVDNGGPNGVGNGNKDMYRITEVSSFVKKVLASEARDETRDSVVEMDAVRRPEVPDTLLAVDGYTPVSDGVKHVDQHQLLLCLALGVGLTLSVVLAVLLLLLLRRHCSWKPSNDQPSAQETLAGVLVDRLLGRDDDHEESGGGGLHTGQTGGSFYSSATPFVDDHQYEPIRSDLLPPPLPSRSHLLPLLVGPQPQSHTAHVF